MPLLVDSGILYALADADDSWHERAVAWSSRVRDLLLVPVTVVPEVAHLLHTRLGPEAELRFASALARRELVVEQVTAADFERCVELLAAYPDIGTVDASLVAVAERLHLAALVTTDRRHLSTIRPRHRQRFELLP
jgi:predicted nucleic acid-binding protein